MRVLVNNTCIKDTCKTIVVTTPCNLIANFTSVGIMDTLNNLAVAFTNTSMGFAAGDSIRWTFGDGSAPSFDVNPVHIFPHSSYYVVCLRVVRNNPGAAPCVGELCRAVYVAGSVNCDTVRVSYTYRRDTYMPNRVYFYGASNQMMQSQTWTIRKLGDSNRVVIGQYNPMHMFNETGTYEVCLSAVTVGNCLKEYCDTITINSVAQQCILTPVPNPATTQVSVQAVLSSPNTIYAFIYNAQNVLVSQRILSGYAGTNNVTFNVSNLVSGYYTIRLYHSGQMCLSRFMKL
jgi:PKD repeat protein